MSNKIETSRLREKFLTLGYGIKETEEKVNYILYGKKDEAKEVKEVKKTKRSSKK